MKLPIMGQCLCGNISYEITELPKLTGICHCHSCQKETGSVGFAFLAVSRDAVTITGKPKWFSSKGASGHPIERGFCNHCGSTLFGRPKLWESIMSISASSLNNPFGYQPQVNVWLEDAQEWFPIDKNLECFEQNKK